MNYEQWRQILKNERLPTVIVDLDAFDRNVKKIASYVNGGMEQTLRIATKSLRVPDLIKRILQFGPPYRGLLCFAAEEALQLYSQGFDDLLVAYPTVQSSDLRALREIHDRGGKIKLVIDHVHQISIIASHFEGCTKPLSLLIDCDAALRFWGGAIYLGVRRSSVRTGDDVIELIDESLKYKVVKIVGALAYEAQIAGLGDKNPFKKILNPIIRLVRKMSVPFVAQWRRDIAQAFESRGLKIEIFNGGGTGSLNTSSQEKVLTELAAGSGFLCPHLFDYYSNITLEPAFYFALQVDRISEDGYITCLGGGYVASGEPNKDRLPIPVEPSGLALVSAEGCGEVQTPLKVHGQVKLLHGDPVLFRPAKAGELAERFNDYLLISHGQIISRVKTYRGYGWSFF